MKYLVLIPLLFLFVPAYAQDCDVMLRDSTLGDYYRIFQRDTSRAVTDSSKIACKLWVEKNNQGIMLKSRREDGSFSFICAMKVGQPPLAVFNFADTSIKYTVYHQYWADGNFGFIIDNPQLLRKLSTQPLVSFKGDDEYIHIPGLGQRPVRTRVGRRLHYYCYRVKRIFVKPDTEHVAWEMKYNEDISFTFKPEEAAKLMKGFQCLGTQ